MNTHDRGARIAKLAIAGLAVLAASVLVVGGVAAYSLLGKDDSEKGTAPPQPSRNQARPTLDQIRVGGQ